MELLLAILLRLGLFAAPDQLSDEEFLYEHRTEIDRAVFIIEGNYYSFTEDGGIVIDPEVSP